MSAQATTPVRIGVFVSGGAPGWVPILVERLRSSSDFDPVVVRAIPEQHIEEHGTVFRFYEWLDRRVFGASEPAIDELGRSHGIVLLDHAQDDAAADVPTMQFAVWAGRTAPPESLRHVSAHPIRWVEHHPDPVEGFLEAAFVIETCVLTHAGSDHVRVLDRVVSRTEPLSLERTRSLVAEATAELLIRGLQRGPALDDELPLSARQAAGRPARSRPTESLAAASAMFRAARTGVLRKARSARFTGHWVVAHRRREGRGLPPGDMTGFTLLPTPTDHDYADPFLVRGQDGRRFIFFEDLPHAVGRAHISRVELYPDGTTSDPVCVLSRSYHLSYPFVFAADEEWYMLPETDENRAVELYRAVDFPDRWELDRTLLANVRAVDTTPFVHGGRTWIFSSTGPADGGLPETLSLYSAESLMSSWRPHPQNPIVADIRGGRSAGRILTQDGRLIRPAQDGSRGYGWSLLFNEIVELSEETYREVEIGRIEPGWHKSSTRTHHYDADDEYETVDCHLLIPRGRQGRRANP